MVINCRGILLDLTIPVVMGILNITPDSFYDGNSNDSEVKIKKRIDKMISQNPSIVDIGGMSSRPGAQIVGEDEEWKRIRSAIQYITTSYPTQIISLDTIHSEVARKGLENGVHIINDISGGVFDPEILSVTAQYKAPIVLMHMSTKDNNIQSETEYPRGVATELLAYFKDRIKACQEKGITDIIVDLGFGFSKSIEQTYQLLNQLHAFKLFGYPILTGISRKSMIYKVLENSPSEALTGTIALNMKALLEGTSILRVHDVKEANETIKIFNKLKEMEMQH